MRPSVVRWTAWRTVIGLELHVQLAARSKLFSRSKTSWDDEPNTNTSLIDVGYPGTLPTISPAVVQQGLRTALALNCDIPAASSFDRKHYFYHDQPLGYQITQHYHPLARTGYLEIPTTPPKRIRIQQIQLEQDTAKTMTVGGEVLIDYNRAGTGLMEIVTEADISSGEEAALFLKAIRAVLRRIGASNADMEKGELRVDCNISIHKEGEAWGDRVELKNVALVNQLQKAITFEVERHKRILEAGGKIETETRGFDLATGETRSLRSKEEVKDYRYMPDGNLPVLRPSATYLAELKAGLPELPHYVLPRLRVQYPTLTQHDAVTLLALDPDSFAGIAFFERTAALRPGSAKAVCNWIVGYVGPALGKEGRGFAEGLVSEEEVSGLAELVEKGDITHASAQKLVTFLVQAAPSSTSRLQPLIAAHSLAALPASALDALIDAAQTALPKAVANVTSGKKPSDVGKLVGWVVKESKGRADAKEVMRRMRAALGLEHGEG